MRAHLQPHPGFRRRRCTRSCSSCATPFPLRLRTDAPVERKPSPTNLIRTHKLLSVHVDDGSGPTGLLTVFKVAAGSHQGQGHRMQALRVACAARLWQRKNPCQTYQTSKGLHAALFTSLCSWDMPPACAVAKGVARKAPRGNTAIASGASLLATALTAPNSQARWKQMMTAKARSKPIAKPIWEGLWWKSLDITNGRNGVGMARIHIASPDMC